jgi:metallo-beta-lactamase family protein
MEITFYGAARTVTGSQHLLDVNGYRILLDCGFYQGPRQESKPIAIATCPSTPATVDVLILSHAHIDHSGNIPSLVKSGFTGDIVSTSPRAICAASCCATAPRFRNPT